MRDQVIDGEVTAFLEVILTDSDDNVVYQRKMKSNSFVRQFLDLMFAVMAQFTSGFPVWGIYQVRDIANTLRSVAQGSAVFNATAAVGAGTNGIVVGTGSTAPAMSDFRLATPIAHGTGAGQLQYGAMTFGSPVTDGTLCNFRLTRAFSNASGGTITVREIGLCVTDGSANFLTIRDVVVPINIPNGQILTVNYQIVTSV